MIRAPAFWWRSPGLRARLLRPLGAVYGAVAARRMSRPGERPALPVLCVGNFTVGGAGKTPFAVELARRLEALGETPAFLTRGYGGSLAGPLRVARDGHGASEVGDEALLLAGHAPTVVARSRVAGARLAAELGASVIVMDDGLQNPALTKDVSFAVVDSETGLGNGLCLPAGPLRAPLATQWRFVKALVLMQGAPIAVGVDEAPGLTAGPVEGERARFGPGASPVDLALEARRRGLPAISAALVLEAAAAAALRGRRLVAFAAIGRPEKFFSTLRGIGANIMAEHGFPDHHNFSAGEIAELAAKARKAGAVLATTEKDAMRLEGRLEAGGDTGARLAGIPLSILEIGVRIEDGAALDALLRSALALRRAANDR
jgi:tetraacyldisaccharide 4'-kinase